MSGNGGGEDLADHLLRAVRRRPPEPDVIDADLHGLVPLSWWRYTGNGSEVERVRLVKRAPCDGSWVDEMVLSKGDHGDLSIVRRPGPFFARWVDATAGSVGGPATTEELRHWMAERELQLGIVRFKATPGESVSFDPPPRLRVP